MTTRDGRPEPCEMSARDRSLPFIAGAHEATIRARVRAIVKAHGGRVGESWDAQADHAEQVVAEVIECQGLAAGRRWASSLDAELSAGCDGERMAVPGAIAPGFDFPAALRPGRP